MHIETKLVNKDSGFLLRCKNWNAICSFSYCCCLIAGWTSGLVCFGTDIFRQKMKYVDIHRFKLASTVSAVDMNNGVTHWKSWQLVCGLLNPARRVPYRTGFFPIYGIGLNPSVTQWTSVVNMGLELKAVFKNFNYNRSQSFILYFKVQGPFFFNLMLTRITVCKCAQITSMCVSLLCALLCQKEV